MLRPVGGCDLASNEGPTAWALSMRKWVICLWIVFLGLFIARCVVLDLFGALSMIIVVILGYFVPFGNPPMQQRWVMCWGIFCALNCIVDFIFGLMYLVRYLNGYPAHPLGYFAGTTAGPMQDPNRKFTPMEEYMLKVELAAVIIGLVVPFVEIIIAWVCYKLFKDCSRAAYSESDAFCGDPHSGFYGSAGHSGGGGGGGSVYSHGRRLGGGETRKGSGVAFQPFEGGGQRLG